MALVEVLNHNDREIAWKIRELQRAAYRVEAGLIGSDQMPPLKEEVIDIVRLDLTILGAEEGVDLVGLLGYTRLDDAVDIDRLAVQPTRFRQGIGGALLYALHHRESDVRRFSVSTGAANRPAIALYEAMGYGVMSEELSSDVRLAHLERRSDA